MIDLLDHGCGWYVVKAAQRYRWHSVVSEKLTEALETHRFGEEKSLTAFAIEFLEQFELCIRFNPLGDDLQAKRTSQIDDGPHDLIVIAVRVDHGNK